MFTCNHCHSEPEKDYKGCPVCGYDRAEEEKLRREFEEKERELQTEYDELKKALQQKYEVMKTDIPPENAPAHTGEREKVFGLAGFVVGLVSAALGCNVLLGVIAVIFSAPAYNKLPPHKRGFAVAGYALSISSIIVFVFSLILTEAGYVNLFGYLSLIV